MRSLRKNRSKVVMLVAMATLVTAGSCTQRTKQTAVPPPSTPEQTTATPATTESTPPSQTVTVPSGPTHLNEIRLIETGGQRSVLFRFSRPPEGVDYFPLRNPSRLVVDIKGITEPPAKIQTYKTTDTTVSAVRIGTYQGKLRLVIDLKSPLPPQFSVDSYETLVTAFIGEKDTEKSATQSHAQVLFISEEARTALAAGTHTHGPAEKETKTLPHATSPESPTSTPADTTQTQVATAPTALTEEKISHTPAAATTPETAKRTTPMEIAQVSPGEEKPPTPPAPGVRSPRRAEHDPLLSEESPPSGPIPRGEFQPTPTTQYTGRRISLDFKNADVHDVFRILADVSGLNIVATDDVKARVTLRLIEVPWDQALDVVLQANGLEKTRVGNVLSISTTKRLEAERNARLLAQNANQKLAPLDTAYVRINYVKATDIVSIVTIEQEQKTGTGQGAARPAAGGSGGDQKIALMSPRGTIAADPTTNVVIIRDISDRIAAIRELIRNVDVQTPQVVIESYLITTNENINHDLGIQWGYGYRAGPGTGNPTGRNFPGTIGLGGSGLGTGSGNIPFIADFPAATSAGSGSALDLVLGSLSGSQALAVRLSALEREGKARVISRPRVVTINNKVAEIKSRRTVRVPDISGSLNVGGAGSTQGGGDAFQEFDVGITLKITPQISSDGFVLLDVAAESSELAPASVTPSGPSSFFPIIPDTLLRTASSNVLIRAGDTFVLGGILADSMSRAEEGTPYLRKVPGLGWLFRGNTNSRTKDELLVFITPKLVPGVTLASLPSAQQLWENRETVEETTLAPQEAARLGQ